MINYSNDKKSAFSGSTQKNLSLTFDDFTITNGEIVQESMGFEQTLCDDMSLKFGKVVSSCFSIEIKSIDENLVGKTFIPKLSASSYIESLGTYKVYSDTLSSDKTTQKIVAYDKLYEILSTDYAEWYNGLTFPMKLSIFRNEFFTKIGIEQEVVSLVNDEIRIRKGIDTNVLSGRDILQSICEMNGCFGFLDFSGKFKYITLSNNNATLDIDGKYDISSTTYENFEVKKIDNVVVRMQENDIGYSTGDTGNIYTIQSNFLLYGLADNELQTATYNILSAINNIYYIPSNVLTIGYLWVEPGDNISFYDPRYDVHIKFPVLNRSMSGISALRDNFSAKGTETYSDNSVGLQSELNAIKGRYNVLERNINETKSEIVDSENRTNAKITQTANSFSVEIQNLQEQIDGAVEMYYTTEEPTLTNYPAIDFTYSFPILEESNPNKVALSENNKWEYKDEFYKKKQGALVYDETNYLSYRFVKDAETKQWYWKALANTDFGVAMEKIAKLEVKTDGITSSVSEVTTEVTETKETVTSLQSQVTQMPDQIKREISSVYSTKEELGSAETRLTTKIEESATSVKTEISTEYVKNDETYKTFKSTSEQTSTKIEWIVSSGTSYANFKLTDQVANLVAQQINARGLVTLYGINQNDRSKLMTTDSTIYYLASSLNKGVTTSTEGWTPDASGTNATMTPEKKYLWMYSVNRVASGSYYTTTPKIIGVYGNTGEKGDTGEKGEKGSNGINGISVVKIQTLYYQSQSTNIPSAPNEPVTDKLDYPIRWSLAQPSFRKSYPYYYICSQIKYSNNMYDWSEVTICRDLSKMGDWCSANDVTYIDGSKIYTGSITAKQIDVTNLFAQTITATGTINGGKFNGGSFTLTADATSKASSYTSTDRSNADKLILNALKPTASLYAKYDINRDGKISIIDLGIIDKFISGDLDEYTVSTRTLIRPNGTKPILFQRYDENNSKWVETGFVSSVAIKTALVECDRITVDSALWVNDKIGTSGTFKSTDGKTVTVTGGIITSIK